MNRRFPWLFAAGLGLLALGLALPAQTGRAQPVVSGQGLKFADYYEPPHDTQMKSLLEGAEVQAQPDGRYLVRQAKYRTFRETGEGELVVEAPECVYDRAQRSISSGGALHLQTADGKFSIEGEGFLWQQTNSTLLVSNRVHTTLHPELFRPPSAAPLPNAPAAAAPPVEIFSDRFDYALTPGRGVYQGNVRVTGTNLNSTAGKLTLLLPLAERRLQSLTAEERVVVDYEKIHATGDWAFYSAARDQIEMKGQPTWRMDQREGSGDELAFDRPTKVFRANGHARLQMPASSMGAGGFLSPPGSASAPVATPANQLVEIQCSSYELRTNAAVFRDQVQVSQRVGDQEQGRMTCGLMTLTLTGTNELQKMVAEREVVISQAERQFTAAKADYTAATSMLELTGAPTWRDGPREGKGDLMRVNLAGQEMLVQGNARMKLPAAELGRATLTGTGAPRTGRVQQNAPGFAEIYAQDYLLTVDSALFKDGVRVEHPQMNWTCEELTMLSPPELGKGGRMMIAEPSVVFDMLDDQGRSYHGTGKRAVYTRQVTTTLTNDLMELTGTPATVAATNVVVRNRVIALDLTAQKVTTPGKYDFRGTLPPSATNFFRLPGSG